MMTQTNEVDAEGIVTRDDLIARGCEEEIRRKRATFYIKDSEVVARNCTKCKRITMRDYMTRHAGKYGGLGRFCLECNKEAPKRWKDGNKDRVAETSKKYRENNKARISETTQKYREVNRVRITQNNRRHRLKYERKLYKNNPEIKLIRQQRRRARERALPDDLTAEQLTEINATFYNTCALSGEPMDLHLDHVIPLSTGHGGTTYGNMIPLSAELNLSKHAQHIIEWFQLNRERFNLSQRKFDELITYLAEANEMTTDEYRAYVDWCFDNPRVIDEASGELVFKDGTINEHTTKGRR